MTDTARLTTALADRYAIERELGAGGMATVYLARDLKHDRDVALKVLRPELAAVLGAERFLQEIRISARLDHPHILTLIDSGESDGFVWYVLPYVRGESLREKLTREQQLSIEEAVRIATQVASALDYAHHHGVIHRDIKPENILLHEGEAVVADFGIALAVREAGGPRLTESGLSLGTPQYMSPEQATGGRELDARSDVYSLAAVVYEMLTGEPPHTGPTVQAVIAKLLTERPTRIRTVRDTVPEGIDSAVAKALAKVPADRFQGAEQFATALAVPRAGPTAGWRRRSTALVAGIVGAFALAAALWLAVRATGGRRAPALVVRDRAQLTFTGNAAAPAISGDGKQLAYVVKRCAAAACAYGIEVQDVGGGASRRVVDGTTALYWIGWSPDRRYLIFLGSIAARYGSYIASTLGGAPRFLGVGAVTFFPGGDSLLLTSPPRRDSVAWVWVATLDGDHRDSLRIDRPGDGLDGAWLLAGGRWIVVEVLNRGRPEWRIVDRHGRQRDGFGPLNNVYGPMGVGNGTLRRVTADALWLLQIMGESRFAVVRVPIDARKGRFAGGPDTVLVAPDDVFDVTADGSAIVYQDGTAESDLWAVGLTDALRGRFAAAGRLVSSTSLVEGVLSPDGRWVLVMRRVAEPGGERYMLAVVPFENGAEVVRALTGTRTMNLLAWMPGGGSFFYVERADVGVRIITIDARTGARLGAFAINDSIVTDVAALAGGGWAWIPQPTGPLRVQRPGDPEPRELPKPDDDAYLVGVMAGPEGSQLTTMGWTANLESLTVHEISQPEGRATRWATFFCEGASMRWLAGGSIVAVVMESQRIATVYRVRGPGRVEKLGTIPRPVEGVDVSRDGRRAVVLTKESHRDIWLARVARVGR